MSLVQDICHIRPYEDTAIIRFDAKPRQLLDLYTKSNLSEF